MTFKIPTSPKLKSLEADLADKKAQAATANAELLRLTKLLRRDHIDVTVINRTRPARASTIDVWSAPNANVSIGISESQRKEDDRNRVLRGEPLEDVPDLTSQISQANRLCVALDDAIESIMRDIKREQALLAQQFCNEQKADHDKDMASLCKGLTDAHAAFVRVNKLRQHLKDNDMGFRGVCLLLPDSFLDNPLNKDSQMANFLMAAKRDGYVKTIPAEYAA